MTRKDLYKELRALAILLFAITVAIGFTALTVHKVFLKNILAYLAIYCLFAILMHGLSTVLKNKRFVRFATLFFTPLGVLYAILVAIFPFISLIFDILLYFGVALIIPEMIFRGLDHFQIIDFVAPSARRYLQMTLTVLISILLNPVLRDIVKIVSLSRLNKSKELKTDDVGYTLDFLLSTQNIRFLIYGSYFLALLTTNFFSFQGYGLDNRLESDKSILQSLVTFLAFDRAFILMKQLNFKPSLLLENIYKSISNKVNDNSSSSNSQSK